MRHTLFTVVVITCAIAGVAIAQSPSQNNTLALQKAQDLTRAPIFVAGGWTSIDCSNVAAAVSAQLTSFSQYVIGCEDDSRLAWGTSTVVADANDLPLYEGAWLRFVAAAGSDYVSCLNVNEDSICRYIEVK